MASKQQASDKRGVKRKHNNISIQEKVELLQKLDRGVSVRHLCNAYGIGSSTVYDIKKQREKLMHFFVDSDSKKQMAIRKTMKDGKSTEHDKIMIQWFRQRRSDGVDLSGALVMEQAKLYHEQLGLEYDCEYGEGWLHRFKKRHGVTMKKVCGEKRSADHDAAAEFVEEFARFIAKEHRTPEQVYNADETALYWRCTPKRTLATEDEEAPTGLKASKDRVTILGCSNAAGTHKCKPMVIGRSKKPRALKNVKIYPVIYRGNKKGWITTELTLEWFEKYFVPEARAHCTSVGLPSDCKIVLLLDNCSAHPKAERMNKNNVSVMYLPPNCTSIMQPQDQGILRSLKAKYRSLFMKRMLNVVNAGKPVETFIKEFNMKDVLWFISSAWGMVEAKTLKQGWHKLWPAMMFEKSPDETDDNDFTGFNVSKEKTAIHELLDYARSVDNPYGKDVGRRLTEENVDEWMNVDSDAPTVHQYSDAEIVDMVLHPNKSDDESEDEASSDEDEPRVNIDKIIDLSSELIKALEQRDASLISEQELTVYYMVHDRLIRQRPKLMKQMKLTDLFKKSSKKKMEGQRSTPDEPVPSTSSASDTAAVPASRNSTSEDDPDDPPFPDVSA